MSNSAILTRSEYLPESLRDSVLVAFDDFIRATPSFDSDALDPRLLDSLVEVWSASPFIAGTCAKRPDILKELESSSRLFNSTSLEELGTLLRQSLGLSPSEFELMVELRRFRNREMVRIGWRDIGGFCDIDETMRDLSWLAEVCLQESLAILFNQACEARGTPLNRHGQPQSLVVLAMGKLGAHELNYSSDIDLIFSYRDDGVLADKKATSYSEFYTRLARSLVKVIDAVTEDGMVFRVDTRLRPFGESGPLVMNFDGMESYYQSQAREWERYAMVKVRAIAGDLESGRMLEDFLRPFVYRRYLDYRALGELRELKQKISQELLRKDRQENIKLGPGGIREIEFIGQVFQLIRGGPEKRLRERKIQVVLATLAELGLLPREVTELLTTAYRYLRRLENRLQEYMDRQTHDLPVASKERLAIARSMGHADWDSFKQELDDTRASVHGVFEQVFSPEAGSRDDGPVINGDTGQIELALRQLEWQEKDIPAATDLLSGFFEARSIRNLTPRGIAELKRLMPEILRCTRHLEDSGLTLERLLKIIEAIASRNVYLTLLAENPKALQQLVRLAAASPWISHFIARSPQLLDELLDPRSLLTPLSKLELARELKDRLDGIDPDDLEQFMFAMRHFKQSNVLKVAAADLFGAIPLMVVSDYLTTIAETVLDASLLEAWRQTVEKCGVPPSQHEDTPGGFAVIAYGKLGGYELGYGSDLDLVFLFDGDATALTNGRKPVTTFEFYARLGKRIIHLLTTNTLSGVLYEVDLRLRPSGSSGLLVSHVDAYEHYQLDQAWTWEQQALVKARCVAGDALVAGKFSKIREISLRRLRDPQLLRAEVSEMRKKMRESMGSKDDTLFNIKHDSGGIVDIEFLVQFGVLSLARSDARLTDRTDVVRILESLAESGFLSDDAAVKLKMAYCAYRDCYHRSALLEVPAVVEAGRFKDTRAFVQSLWRDIMET